MKHFQFGKYRISVRKLKENILSTSTEKKSQALKPIMITGKVRDLLLDYRDHTKFNMTSYNNLNPDEKIIIDQLLKASGMDDHLGIRLTDKDMDELIQRYELLRGQVLAGNDATEIRKELRNVVLQLVRLNKLPLRQSHELLVELLLLDNK